MDYIRGKIRSLDDLAIIVAQLREKGLKIALCHGVFDLVHIGHIRYLNAAKRFGDVLIITITADKFVKRGPGRPVFNENLRAEALANLAATDFVCIVHSPTAIEAINTIKPEFYVKGADYKNKDADVTAMIYEEEAAVNAVGGELVFTDDITFSSSHLINNYFDTYPDRTIRYLKELASQYKPEAIIDWVKQITKLKILVIGDTIIDQYHYCSPLGKSAKENIVVNKYLSKEYFAGGTLATANHVAQLCDNVELVTVLGEKNSFADFIFANIDSRIKPVLFRRPNCVTTVKRRFVSNDANKKLFEICYLDDHPLSTSEEHQILEYLRRNIKSFDLVIVSDFGHGMVTKAIMDLLCTEAKSLALNVQTNSANLGFNLVTKYRSADFICIDEQELRFATQDRYSEIPTLVTKVADILKPKQIIVTRGAIGSVSFSPENGFLEAPALTSQAVDKVGAGDAFFAYTSPCFRIGMPQELISLIGNCAGAIAVQIVCNREPVKQVDLFKFLLRLFKL